MEVALQTPERDLTSFLSPICSAPPIRRRTSCTFEIHSVTATVIQLFKQQPETLQRVTIPHLIFGAPVVERRRMMSRSGLRIGSALRTPHSAIFPQPSLVCTTTSTRRLGLCSSIDPLGDARNFVEP